MHGDRVRNVRTVRSPVDVRRCRSPGRIDKNPCVEGRTTVAFRITAVAVAGTTSAFSAGAPPELAERDQRLGELDDLTAARAASPKEPNFVRQNGSPWQDMPNATDTAAEVRSRCLTAIERWDVATG